jgi:hypothetical protein
MKKLIPLVCLCLLAVAAQAQRNQRKSGSHSFNLNYGFAYASDVSHEQEMRRGFTGFGYQYTTKKNWYIGADMQYTSNNVNDPNLGQTFKYGNGDMYACPTPRGGIGYFFAPAAMLQSASIITSNNVYKVPADQQNVAMQDLQATRVNLMINAGRRWDFGRGQLETGLTLMGTFYNRESYKHDMRQQAIPCRSNATGQEFQAMFNVSSFDVVNQRSFWMGGGLHARYNYNISSRIGIGMQVLASASTEGLFAQAAPRIVMNLRNKRRFFSK